MSTERKRIRNNLLDAYPLEFIIPLCLTAMTFVGLGAAGATYDALDETVLPITLGEVEMVNPALLATGALSFLTAFLATGFLISKINRSSKYDYSYV